MWHQRLFATGQCYYQELDSEVSSADTANRVKGSSRFMFAAFGQLARSCYCSLGGKLYVHEVGRAAAMLSLLTKIDDQKIDDLAFHGWFVRDQEGVISRVRDYLAATLDSIVWARPLNKEPRCQLAARLGQEIRALAPEKQRLEHLLSVITQGWETQARAVAVLSSHPEEISLQDVRQVTADIGGAFGLMLTLIGTLPQDTDRLLTDAEEEAFYEWGFYIQAADALADLEKDIGEGMISSFPGYLAWTHNKEAYLEACQQQDIERIYQLFHTHNTDVACLPQSESLTDLDRKLSGLSENASLLRWLHGFILWRYLNHPRCVRKKTHPDFRSYGHDALHWQEYVDKVGVYLDSL